MLSTVISRAQVGIDSPAVIVETHISSGLPKTTIVGLPETAVKESRDRVRSALLNSHFEYPDGRITINLAPADLIKLGTRFDLPIALGILVASGQLPERALEQFEAIGELALDGRLRSISGCVGASIYCHRDGHSLLLPEDNAAEAALVDGACVIGCRSLLAVCAHLRGTHLIEPASGAELRTSDEPPDLAGLDDVRGQYAAKRVLGIAAAGGHNVLMSGPPGVGKTMLARRLPTLLPALTKQEQLEVMAIRSAAGDFPASMQSMRPFRAPHRTASAAALVGGGSHPRPGEISRAHRGVLFLDELPEWPRKSIELLREPIELGRVMISRAAAQIEFPARFQLIAAMNPCPCGYSETEHISCRCTPAQIERYRAQLSGPMLDRFDMLCTLDLPDRITNLGTQSTQAMPVDALTRAVTTARQRQLERQGKLNAELSVEETERLLNPLSTALATLERVATAYRLSLRACHRIMRTARTIADLSAQPAVEPADVLEACSYRTSALHQKKGGVDHDTAR